MHIILYFLSLFEIVLSLTRIGMPIREGFSLKVIPGDGSDDSAVNEILGDIFKRIAPVPRDLGEDAGVAAVEDEKLTTEAVQESCEKLLSDIRDNSSMEPRKRNRMIAELSLLQTDAKEDSANLRAFQESSSKLSIPTPASSVFDPQVAPYCVVTGPGVVGQALQTRLRALGAAAEVRFLAGDHMNSLTDNEIRFAVRGARTILLAVDSAQSTKPKGIFDVTPPKFLMDERAIKRLLDTVVEERRELPTNNRPYVKVVALGAAAKSSKSAASFLVGDTTDFESEVVLQCERRGLGYTIVKIGEVIGDEEGIGTSRRPRGASARQLVPPETSTEMEVAWALPRQTISIERRSVKPTEATRVTAAVEALMRAATHPTGNCSYSVLSVDPVGDSRDTLLPDDEEWADELIKADGPELLRIPLRFASSTQVAVRLGRIALDLQKPGSGLVTRIETERFTNGARLLFRPSQSNYKSAAEEKLGEKNQPEEVADAMKSSSSSQKAGYVSPEEEAQIEEARTTATQILSPEEIAARRKASGADSRKKNSPPKKEGGLEVLVESTPYPRVRVRRTNMDKDTIVKVESEQIILNALKTGILGLERDYKTLMLRSRG